MNVLIQIALQAAKMFGKQAIKSKAAKSAKSLLPKVQKKSLIKKAFNKELTKKVIQHTVKTSLKSKGTNLIPKEIRFLYKFIKTEDKLKMVIERITTLISIPTKEQIRKEIRRQNWEDKEPQLKEVWKQWDKKNKEIEKEMIALWKEKIRLEKELIKYAKIADKLAQDLAKEQIKKDKENQKLGQVIIKRALDKDFKSFKDFYKQLDGQEQKRLNDILSQENRMYVVFNSTWINFANFTPYYKVTTDFNDRNWDIRDMVTGNTRGVMNLEIKGRKGMYSWINITYSTWLKIISDPTGTNFWKAYYRTNRKNVKHITPKSKYYAKKRI